MAGVSVRALRKRYPGAPRDVLSDVSLELADGGVCALLGPSGCGKTTTLRAIAGLERADAGEIRIGERTAFDAARGIDLPPEARRLGMVFQAYAVWPHLTVADNVAYPLRLRRVPARERDERVGAALDLVHLGGLGARFPNQLSGGQQQRVALARAIVHAPDVLLLDEPLSNLDRALRDELGAEIAALRRRLGVTVLLVTHDQDEAFSLADEVIVMREGRIEQRGAPEGLFAEPATRFVATFLGAQVALEGVAVDAEAVRLAAGPVVRCRVVGVPPGAACTLLLRPHELVLEDAGALEGAVEAVAFAGDRRALTVAVAGARARVSAPLGARIEPGARVRLAVRGGSAFPPC